MDNTQKQGPDSIGALWKRKSQKTGREYVAGRFTVPEGYTAGDNIEISIFAVRQKKDPEKSPDLLIFERKREEGAQQTNAQRAPQQGNAQRPVAKPVAKPAPVKTRQVAQAADNDPFSGDDSNLV